MQQGTPRFFETGCAVAQTLQASLDGAVQRLMPPSTTALRNADSQSRRVDPTPTPAGFFPPIVDNAQP
jgi:hypothetical protein